MFGVFHKFCVNVKTGKTRNFVSFSGTHLAWGIGYEVFFDLIAKPVLDWHLSALQNFSAPKNLKT